MKNRILTAFSLGLLATALVAGCKRDGDDPSPPVVVVPTVGSVAITVDNVAGAKAVALDGTAYTTASGETFTISTFEYYISNIKLSKADGSSYLVPSSYHLVNAAKASTQAFTLSNIPNGDYTGLSFVVGVDSTTTKSDPLGLTGDLNPANNMYWAWATGHIFMKMEGTVTSVSPNKSLTCHIGGYRNQYSALVTATPALGGTLQVRGDHTPSLRLAADVLKMFDGTTHFALSTFQTTMEPSAASVQIAKNYGAGMFMVKQLSNN